MDAVAVLQQYMSGAAKNKKKRVPRHGTREITLEMRRKNHGNGRLHRPARSVLRRNGACTLIPALQGIEGLLSKVDHNGDKDIGPTVPELPDLSPWSPRKCTLEETSGRYSRQRIHRSTSEFNDCLRLPPLVKSETKSASSRRGEKSPSSAREGETSTLRCIMLPETFAGSTNTLSHVVNILAAAIQLPLEEAQECAERCLDGEIVMLDSNDLCDARQTARSLRESGLIVRVTAKTSVEACTGSGGDRLEQFAKQCYGTLRSDTKRMALNLHRQRETSERMRLGTDMTWNWTRDTNLKLKLVPEDAVDAFLRAEAEADVFCAGGRRDSFRDLVMKHSSSLLKLRASLTTDLPDEQRQSLLQGQSLLQEKKFRRPLSEAWREGCRLMRLLVFGAVGNEDNEDDKDAIYYEPIGSKGRVNDVYQVWAALDSDQSGRVDILEFRAFAENHVRGKKMQFASDDPCRDNSVFVQKLCERLEKLLLGKKSSFAIEDVVRLCWPSATAPDTKTMLQWIDEQSKHKERSRIKPPVVMAKADYEGLLSVYHFYNEDKKSLLHIEELVKNEIIGEEEKQEWCKNHNKTVVTEQEFCEMLCPTGYRATVKSTVGSMPDGRRVVQITGIWRLATDEALESTELT